MRIVLLSTGDDEDFALVLFEEEDMYSVVETSQIRETHYAYNQTVNVLWGKGKDAQYFPAKLVLCGSKDDCEKEVLDLSFTSESASTPGSSSSEGLVKGKRKNEGIGKEVTAKKTKGIGGTLSEEQEKLERAVLANRQFESLQRSHATLKTHEAGPSANDLSEVITRLDAIESKLDLLIKQSKGKKYPEAVTDSPTPISKKESVESIGVESDEEDSDLVYNGVQLLSLKAPPKEPTRYATRLAGVVFTKEEMLAGMVPPLNDKYERTPLDPEKISIIQRCIERRYSAKTMNKLWPDIRRAINQKCNDLRKKQTQ